MSRGTKHRSIRIEDELWDPAKAKAEAEGRNVSDVIRELLKRMDGSEMSDDIYSMTKSGFHEAIRQAKEVAWLEGHSAGRRDEYCLDPNPYAPPKGDQP